MFIRKSELHMNTSIINIQEEFKECACNDCPNIGTFRLTILYLKKTGWFCQSCKSMLENAGLVSENGEFLS